MNKTKLSITINLPCQIDKEKPNLYVSYCPALDLYSQGKDPEIAHKNINEAAQLFIETCLDMGTLKSVLEDLKDTHLQE